MNNQEHTRALAEQIFGKEFSYRRNLQDFTEVFWKNSLPRAVVWVEGENLKVSSITHDVPGATGIIEVPLANPNLIEEMQRKLKV